MSNIDWKKRAEDALGITRQRTGPGDSGTYFDLRYKEGLVPDVIAALAEAYGEGKSEGRAEVRARP